MLTAMMSTTAMTDELRETQTAYRAEMASLREMLATHGPTGNDKLDEALATHLRSTLSEILRLQTLIARLND